MKKIAKILAVVLTLVMALSLAVTSFAATGTGTLTINNAKPGETYSIYKVLDLDFVQATGAYAYTINDDFYGFFEAVTPALAKDDLGKITSQAVYDYINAQINAADNRESAAKLAKDLAKYAEDNTIAATASKTVASDGNSVVMTDLPFGYYVVVPTFADSNADGSDEGYALFMLDTVDDTATIVNKSKYPTPNKLVSDANESKNKTNTAAIGDTLDFEITGTTSDMAGYDTFKFVITDTMENLTYVADSAKLTIAGVNVDLTADASKLVWNAASKTLTVTIANLKDITTDAGRDIVFTYKATVDTTALIGGRGNDNKVTFTYSSNPNTTDENTSTPSKTTTFVLGLNIKKVNTSNQKLAGAEFKLQKAQGTGSARTYVDVYATDGTVTNANIIYSEDDVAANDTYNFVIKGLDEGEYRLVETKAPEGYVPNGNYIEFTLDSEGQIVDGVSSLGSFDLAVKKGSSDLSASSADANTGLASLNVINRTQNELPGTGGAGLYVVAGFAAVAMVGFVIFMIIKKKALAAE